MSLLSTPSARPERLFSLLSLVRAMRGRIAPDEARAWLAPKFRSAETEKDTDPDRERKAMGRVRETFWVARDLKLLNEAGDHWVSSTDLPDTRRKLALYVHAHLRVLDVEHFDSVPLRAYAWYGAFVEEFGLYGTITQAAATLASEIAAALDPLQGVPSDSTEDTKVFNTTKFPAWKDWMGFLGLGHIDLPGTKGFLPDPTRRVAEELASITDLPAQLEATNFLSIISDRLPYLDGGTMFAKAFAQRGLRPPHGVASRLLSQALRNLHDLGALSLRVDGDTTTGLGLSKDPLSKVQFFSRVEFTPGLRDV